MAETLVQYRNPTGTAAEWTTADSVLADAEIGVESDTGKIKIGDGVTTWTALAYFTGGGAGSGDVVGPTSAVDERIAVFDTTTGKLIKDGGVAVAGLATAAQGTLADSATQPGDLGAVATSNDYGDLDNLPTLGTAAATAATDYATAAQGATADTATQPGDLGNSAGLDVGTIAGTVAAGDDSRLSDARTPTAHAASHQGGADDLPGLTAQATATWEAGTGTTETVVSPAKVKAAIVALAPEPSGFLSSFLLGGM